MTLKYAQARIINPWGHRTSHCWCPACERDNLRVAVVGFWLAPDGQFVCFYGLCESCVAETYRLSDKEKTASCGRIQEALVNRYPELLKKLPAEY